MYPDCKTRVDKLRARLTLNAKERKVIWQHHTSMANKRQTFMLVFRHYDSSLTPHAIHELDLRLLNVFPVDIFVRMRNSNPASFFVILCDPLLRRYNIIV